MQTGFEVLNDKRPDEVGSASCIGLMQPTPPSNMHDHNRRWVDSPVSRGMGLHPPAYGQQRHSGLERTRRRPSGRAIPSHPCCVAFIWVTTDDLNKPVRDIRSSGAKLRSHARRKR